MTKYTALSYFRDINRPSKPFSVSSLKQYILLFDNIGILNLKTALEEFQKNNSDENYLDAKWLQDLDIIFDISSSKYALTEDDKRVIENDPQYALNLNIQEICTDLISSISNPHFPSVYPPLKAGISIFKSFLSYNLRRKIHKIEITDRATVIPILPFEFFNFDFPGTSKSAVISVVIDQLPIPDNNIPWEQIIDYRNDSKNQEALVALRKWINKISIGSFSATEIEEELEWLMNQFNRNMRLARMKANNACLETIIKAPLEIIEELPKFKFSKILDPLFALQKRRISLMESEMNSQGNEIAYIIKTKKAFTTK
jgi:hypothetical protein